MRALPRCPQLRSLTWWLPDQQGARKIGWTAFEKAVELLAVERKSSALSVARSVAACQGPRHNTTTAAVHVRLHDDKSTYTGQLPTSALCCPHSLGLAHAICIRHGS